MIVIADSSPINHLIQIGEIDILKSLFGRVLIPRAVYEELSRPRRPNESDSGWAVLRLSCLGTGEREAILLAEELRADQLLLDDLAGRREAQLRRFQVTGTAGILQAAAKEGLLDFREALARLRQTNFHISRELLDKALAGGGAINDARTL